MTRRRTATNTTVDVTQLRLDCEALADLVDDLEALMPEPVADPSVGTQNRQKATSSPPWHPEAALVYFDIHAGVRDLEDKLLHVITGHPRSRGGTVDNTKHALNAIPDLAAAAGPPHADEAIRRAASWLRQAKQLHDIDQRDKWDPLPRRPKSTPPVCPYCRTFALRWNRRTGEVRCTNHDCQDPKGHRPKARMEVGRYTGKGMLVFRDGMQIAYSHEEEGAS